MARSQEQNERMRRERKKQIMQVALHQFTAKGLFATKVKDIAEEAGMAQGLIYHYFESKEEIFIELIKEALDKMNEAAYALQIMPERPHERIKIALDQLILTIKTSRDFVQTCRLIAQATNSTAVPEKAKEIIEEKRDIPYRTMAKIIAEGQKEGTIVRADPDQLAVLFWTSINGLAIYAATREDCENLPDADLLYSMFLEGYKNGK